MFIMPNKKPDKTTPRAQTSRIFKIETSLPNAHSTAETHCSDEHAEVCKSLSNMDDSAIQALLRDIRKP